jgi:hypothetical protein
MIWEEVEKHNCILPCNDWIHIENNYIVHQVRKEGDSISSEAINLITAFTEFVKTQQNIRRITRRIPNPWKKFCSKDQIHHSLLGPRWTMPFCYFGMEYQTCFKAIRGLDVGCNVLANSLSQYSNKFISHVRNVGKYSYEYELFIPHYLYYQKMGCFMVGVDLYPASKDPSVSQGDLRMLDCDDNSIDFFSVAMIVGPSNPASSILDAALCISELHRASSSDCLVYIADFVITPSTIFMALEFGFRVFVNNSYSLGIPIGLFFVKKGTDLLCSRFRRIISKLEYKELILDSSRQQFIENRDLLLRCTTPVRVTECPTGSSS